MGKIFANGINMGDLVTALKEVRTDWNATLAKLDADTGVSGTNYAELWAIAGNQNIDYSGAAEQGDIVKRLQDTVSSINGVNAKLDAESLTDSDYASSYDIIDNINSLTYANGIFNNGADQGDIVRLLYTIKTNINAIQAKLDADETVNSTDYAATNPIGFLIDVEGC